MGLYGTLGSPRGRSRGTADIWWICGGLNLLRTHLSGEQSAYKRIRQSDTEGLSDAPRRSSLLIYKTDMTWKYTSLQGLRYLLNSCLQK